MPWCKNFSQIVKPCSCAVELLYRQTVDILGPIDWVKWWVKVTLIVTGVDVAC